MHQNWNKDLKKATDNKDRHLKKERIKTYRDKC